MSKFNFFDWLALILVVVGGLNWGLVGIFDLDLVAAAFGEMSSISITVYILVSLAAVYLLISVLAKNGKKQLVERQIS